jgi:serine/threonine protein kinase
LVVELLSVLAYINKGGLVHTNLKLDNLLVVRNASSKYFSIKVAGFGCAVKNGFMQAVNWGNFHYSAPEQVLAATSRSLCTVDVNLDTWAVGVILVETLLGYSLAHLVGTDDRLKSFHEKRTFFERVLQEIVRDPDFNLNWVSVIHSMLQYNTKARPSPAEMLNTLMADPAFEDHRWEMLSDVQSPHEAVFMVRTFAVLCQLLCTL